MRRIVVVAAVVLLIAGLARAEEQFEDVVAAGELGVDTGRLEEAARLFEHAGAMSPERLGEIASDRAWVYVRMGNDAIVVNDIAAANRDFALASAIYPAYRDMLRAQWAYAKIAAANEDLDEATEHPRSADWQGIEGEIRSALELNPGDARTHFVFGTYYHMRGRIEKAKSEYLKALGGDEHGATSVDDLREEAAKVVRDRQFTLTLRPVYPPRTEAEDGEYMVYRKGPFVIYNHNMALAKRIAAVLEYDLSLAVLDGVLSPSDPFPEECKVYVFANEEQFRAAGGMEVWAGGQSKIMLQDGRLVSASMNLFQTTPELTESAVPHELTHVRLAASKFFSETTPLWLQEGIAESTESWFKKAVTAKGLMSAREADTLISLEELLQMREYPKDRASNIFYGESLAAVESLVKKGDKEQFWRFMTVLKDKGASMALGEVYGLTPADVEEMVLEWARTHAPPQ